jgi:ATP-dependent Clp protease ATP-binding subunit ClpC
MSELHRFFRPELIGRFDEKIVFKPLSHDIQREIGRLAISQERERLKQRGFDLTVSEAAFEFLIRRGIQKTLGARPIKQTVQKFLGDAIRQALKTEAPSSGILVVSPLADGLSIDS